MQIPIGENYSFTVKILAENSLLPQNLDSVTAAKFTVYPIGSGVPVIETSLANNDITANANYLVSITVEAVTTNSSGVVTATSTTYSSSTNPTGTEGTVVAVTIDNTDPEAVVTTTTTTVTTNINSGILTCTLPGTELDRNVGSVGYTDLLTPDRGSTEDYSYYKPSYEGSLVINFSDRGTVTVSVPRITAITI